MPQLFSISFTTKTMVNKFDARGKLIAQSVMANPIVMHALPHAAAQSYKTCDDFKMWSYVADAARVSKRSASDAGHTWGGAATKKVTRSGQSTGASSAPVSKPKVDKIAEAARTGNLGAAVSA